MDERAEQLLKIRRNYRIEPSEALREFWAQIEKKQPHEESIPFRFFNLRFLTQAQVADFDPKELRFWFKTRASIHLVQYYIPLAHALTSSEAMFVAAYDRNKHFIGVFHCNLNIDPVFITADLFSLLDGTPPPASSKEAFLAEKVSPVLLVDCSPESFYYELQYDEAAIAKKEQEKIMRLLEYLKLVYPVVQYEEKFEVKVLKKQFKFLFSKNSEGQLPPGPDFQFLRDSIYELDTILPILNLINYRIWNSGSNMMAEYGFYRTEKGVVMLHIEQLCEFVRWGVIPAHYNAHFPAIIYSSQPSGYRDVLEYEVRMFETQEEYSKYYKEFMDAKYQLVRPLEEKDIPLVIDYFLNSTKVELTEAGLDELLIPSEETLLEELHQCMNTENAAKEQFNMIFEMNRKTYGHARLDQIAETTAHFFFFNWEPSFRRQDTIDPWMEQAIELIRTTYPTIRTIYTELSKEDNYRAEILQRAGFEEIGQETFQRDKMSIETTYTRWRLRL